MDIVKVLLFRAYLLVLLCIVLVVQVEWGFEDKDFSLTVDVLRVISGHCLGVGDGLSLLVMQLALHDCHPLLDKGGLFASVLALVLLEKLACRWVEQLVWDELGL